MGASDHLPAARLGARLLLEQLAEAGVDHLPRPAAEAAASPPTVDLTALEASIHACQACPLGASRTQAVPGEGAVPARLMLIGEGPGAEEDKSGRPFVGPAGQLLERILEGGMGLRREQVYIANMVKCRPPGNRNPAPEEMLACRHYLDAQIQAVQPELILALGRIAAQALLQTTEPLGRLRGRLMPLPGGGPPVLATYHPAYLLRRPEDKGACWEDIQVGMAHLGLARPGNGV